MVVAQCILPNPTVLLGCSAEAQGLALHRCSLHQAAVTPGLSEACFLPFKSSFQCLLLHFKTAVLLPHS